MVSMPVPCSAAQAMTVLGRRWAVPVLRDLVYGRHRFADIAEATGAPRDVLTQRLRDLEEAGLIQRVQYSERPPRFEYHLTQAGQEFRPVLLMLTQWGDRWAWPEPPDELPVTFHHHPGQGGDGHVLQAALSCGACGRPVREGEIFPVGPGVPTAA